MEKTQQAGTRRTFWLPKKLNFKAEQVRKKLGLGRSGFYRYAVTRLIDESLDEKLLSK